MISEEELDAIIRAIDRRDMLREHVEHAAALSGRRFERRIPAAIDLALGARSSAGEAGTR